MAPTPTHAAVRLDPPTLAELARTMSENAAIFADAMRQAAERAEAAAQMPGMLPCGDHVEWLCPRCSTAHPWQSGDRFAKACPTCGAWMHPSSPDRREIERLRAEIAEMRRAATQQTPAAYPVDFVTIIGELGTARNMELVLPDGTRLAYPVTHDGRNALTPDVWSFKLGSPTVAPARRL